MQNDHNRLPGIGTTRAAAYRQFLFSRDHRVLWPGGLIVDGSKSRDPGNAGDSNVLRAGMLLGKISASGKFAPSIIGTLQGAASSGATAVTVTPAQAAEIVRRIGSTGTLRFVGPPSAGGTVGNFTETYSAVNTGTGQITVSALDAALIAGTFVSADDGSHLPRCIQGKEDGLKVTDQDNGDIDVPLYDPVIGGLVDFSQLIEAPTDAALVAWVKQQLRTYGYAYAFDDDF